MICAIISKLIDWIIDCTVCDAATLVHKSKTGIRGPARQGEPKTTLSPTIRLGKKMGDTPRAVERWTRFLESHFLSTNFSWRGRARRKARVASGEGSVIPAQGRGQGRPERPREDGGVPRARGVPTPSGSLFWPSSWPFPNAAAVSKALAAYWGQKSKTWQMTVLGTSTNDRFGGSENGQILWF